MSSTVTNANPQQVADVNAPSSAVLNIPKPRKTLDPSKKMRLWVLISGLSPFCLQCVYDLEIHHYKEIVEQYYLELYAGKSPGPIFISKIVHFKNGDKLFEYKRKEVVSPKFTMEKQQDSCIYDEPPPSEQSIVLAKSPAPELCDSQIPKIASLNRLILKLSDPFCHRYLQRVFWFTYRAVISPQILLKKLLQRYDVPKLDPYLYFAPIEEDYYNNTIVPAIKETTLRMLYEWVTEYYFDFEDDMVSSLQNFCQKVKETSFKSIAMDILQAMNKGSREPHWKNVKDSSVIFGVTNSPDVSKTLSQLLNSMEPKEIAEQLTYMDYRLYNEIKFSEMLGQAWNKDKKRHQAPNIIANIEFLNKVGSWVCFSILSENELKKRVVLVKKFIKILTELKEMNSLNMIMAVNAGLTNSAVHRLSVTFDEVDDKTTKERDPINDLVSPQGNSKNMRVAMNNCYNNNLQCAPYIGIYLRDIVFCDDGNPTFVDGRINYMKCIQLYNIMYQVLKFQNREYRITPDANFISVINSFKKVDDNDLFNMSLKVQPRK